jgi:hypothetical protein
MAHTERKTPLQAVQSFIQDVESTLLAVSGSMAVIGVLGLGFMYLGSSLPLVNQWKQEHPKAFNDVTLGLIFLVIASGGGVAAILGTR